jgi:hypothetical protein
LLHFALSNLSFDQAHEKEMRDKELVGKGLKEAATPPNNAVAAGQSGGQEANTLRFEMRAACAGLTKTHAAGNRLLVAAHDVHFALLTDAEIARQTFGGWPQDLLQVSGV